MAAAEDAGSRTGSVCVFDPSPLLTVTVEAGPDPAADIHLHAGGQGFWIARMIASLGVDVRLCGAFGGETGSVLRGLITREAVQLRAAESAGGNGAYIHDRRTGERETVAETPPATLARHEVDELYGLALVEGLDADIVVFGGPPGPDVLPADTYTRLAADLRAGGVPVIADLSGETLTAALAGGITVVKVSHEDLMADTRLASDDPQALVACMRAIAAEGADHVVVSRAAEPAFALLEGVVHEVVPPELQQVDHHGAGDSMTAGIAAALTHGADLQHAVRLGAAAGALNATRRGLATGRRETIDRLTRHVVVRAVDQANGAVCGS